MKMIDSGDPLVISQVFYFHLLFTISLLSTKAHNEIGVGIAMNV
jgi:hypothetical protein